MWAYKITTVYYVVNVVPISDIGLIQGLQYIQRPQLKQSSAVRSIITNRKPTWIDKKTRSKSKK